MQENKTAGIAFLIDENGFIVNVLHNTFFDPLIIEKDKKKHFITLFSSEEEKKILQLLFDVKRNHAAFNHELEITFRDEKKNIYCSGVVLDTNVLILGSESPIEFKRFLREMMELNNEQVNLLRMAFKERNSAESDTPHISNYLYDELSRLNNDLVAMQRESVKQNARLTELSAEKNKFLGMAAHDIRGPVGLCLNYLELLEDDAEKFTTDQNHYLKNIRHLNSLVLNVVNDLLDIANIESGKFTLELSEVNYESFVAKNIEFNSLLAGKKQIEIEFLPCQETIRISIDKSRIDQVLNNLLSNAVKFSFPRRTVTVSLDTTEDSVITCVKDRGQGIPQNYLDSIFKAFQRSSVKATAGEKSTGLGLAIVKKIIDEHKGKIWVESTEKVGSSFYFSLPLKQSPLQFEGKPNEGGDK